MENHVLNVEEQDFRSQQMSESTQNEKKYQRVREYLNNLEDFQKLYEQCVVSEYVEDELDKRKALRNKAKNLIEEYNNATEEEQEEIRSRRNKDGRYTVEQLKEIANMSDEDIVPKEAEEYEVPARFASSDIQARSVSEVREIMASLMENYDPVVKDAPNWSKTKRDLKNKHDIHIAPKKLKRYWAAIEEKEALNLVKRKLYMDVASKMEQTINNLFEHINNRVGSEGGEYDSMKERVDALERLTEIMEKVTGGKPQKEGGEQGTTVKQEFRFTELDEAKRDNDEKDVETIDIGEGE